jgi:predicted P-loop ATPase
MKCSTGPTDATATQVAMISPALVPSRNAVDEFLACCMKKGTDPLTNFANVKLAFEVMFPGLLRRDEMSMQTMLMRPIVDCENFEPRPVRDIDASHLQDVLQKTVMKSVGLNSVNQAIEVQAHASAYHPVKDYLALRWDGRSRIEQLFPAYFSTEDSVYTRAIARMFLVSMVKRIYEPGCQADYMVVLEGPQGIMKSTACSVLGGEWFSDSLPNVSGYEKDVSGHLRGKWLIEVAEMHAMSKSETAQLKAFISRRVEIYRPPYGRHEVHEPRQCVFIGTTNRDTYLKDETGGRRFWPIRVLRCGENQYYGQGHPNARSPGHIHVDELRRERDQLFAEAVVLYRNRFQPYPTWQFEKQYIEPQQVARFDLDEWEPLVMGWLFDRCASFAGTYARRFALAEMAKKVLDLDPKHLGTREQRRLTTVLKMVGCTQFKDAHGKRLREIPADFEKRHKAEDGES